ISNSNVHDNNTSTDPSMVATAGILLADGDSNIAYNNLVWNNHYGIEIGDGASNSKVYNNTIYGNRYNGIHNGSYGATNTTIENNIISTGTGWWGIWDEGSSTTFATNICTMTGPGCALVGDPKFVSASTSNFHLQSTSPAINAGMTLPIV